MTLRTDYSYDYLTSTFEEPPIVKPMDLAPSSSSKYFAMPFTIDVLIIPGAPSKPKQ